MGVAVTGISHNNLDREKHPDYTSWDSQPYKLQYTCEARAQLLAQWDYIGIYIAATAATMVSDTTLPKSCRQPSSFWDSHSWFVAVSGWHYNIDKLAVMQVRCSAQGDDVRDIKPSNLARNEL